MSNLILLWVYLRIDMATGKLIKLTSGFWQGNVNIKCNHLFCFHCPSLYVSYCWAQSGLLSVKQLFNSVFEVPNPHWATRGSNTTTQAPFLRGILCPNIGYYSIGCLLVLLVYQFMKRGSIFCVPIIINYVNNYVIHSNILSQHKRSNSSIHKSTYSHEIINSNLI